MTQLLTFLLFWFSNWCSFYAMQVINGNVAGLMMMPV